MVRVDGKSLWLFDGEHMTSYTAFLSQMGGMASCGKGLGVFVGTDEFACPRGWIFVDKANATPERVQEALDLAKAGRSAWPTED